MSASFLALAFVAGILTVLSPCVLPILPALLSASVSTKLKHRPFWIVLGLVLSFGVLGVTFAYFGQVLGISQSVFRNVALVILLFFGLSLLWPAPWEKISNRLNVLTSKIPATKKLPEEQGVVQALLIGASLGLVWAPCAGPILGLILTLAVVQASFVRSLILMMTYTLGAAVPMLLIGYGGRKMTTRLLKSRSLGEMPKKVLGVLTLLTVVVLYFNWDTTFLAKIPTRFFFASRLEENLVTQTQQNQNPSPESNGSVPAAAVSEIRKSKLPILGDMPEFRGISTWLNSDPMTASSLRGKVVLIDFWTYSCINCIRTLPAVTRWDEKYRDQGLFIIGVHTPEFPFEKDAQNVKRALAMHGIHYPVPLDNDYGTWTAYNNHYWPAKYLIDAQGHIRKTHFGEGDEEEFEKAIQELLQEAKLLHQPITVERRNPGVDFTKIHSHETYIGSARAENFSSPEGLGNFSTTNYTLPSSLDLNEWGLAGAWKIGAESAVLQAPQGRIRFRFRAPKLNLVMKGSDVGLPAQILLDGKPVGPNQRGSDVGDDGRVLIKEPKLYNLIALPAGDDQEHVFELIFENPNVELYAFTFG